MVQLFDHCHTARIMCRCKISVFIFPIRSESFFQQFCIGVCFSFEGVGVTRTDQRVILIWVDQRSPLFCIFFAEQTLHRLFRLEIGIAVIEIPIGESHTHSLVDRMNVSGTVIAHRFEIEIFQDVQCL